MKKIFSKAIMLAAVATATLTSCESEKDLVIIEGNLPIKTSTLYMVGDATPNGWSIDSPTPFDQSDEDPLIFSWTGNLYQGEMKLCLVPGSWDVGFIRPVVANTEINSSNITDATFAMHAGDPDDKWIVTQAGIYTLSFNLREWTMSTVFVGEADAPEITPIEADNVYIIGDAAPNGWNIDAPTELTAKSQYIFEYEGLLVPGELKACTKTGSWDVEFIRPSVDKVEISKSGVADESFVYTTSPDNKWNVIDRGNYRLTFDLENWTVKAEYLGESELEKTPIESETLYMIGDATPGGWSMDDATQLITKGNYIFTWEGQLVSGSMKLCLEPDGTFSCPFIRPLSANVEISENGVAEPDFTYTTGPDDQWQVTRSGNYRLTFDLKNWTISAEYLDGTATEPDDGDDNQDPDVKPLESNTLFMIGDATPGGWSMDDLSEFTAQGNHVFIWEGNLTVGDMKACLQPDGTFSCPFLRPTYNGCEISGAGLTDCEFVYTTDPDDKWHVSEAGKYRLTFDLASWTMSAVKL